MARVRRINVSQIEGRNTSSGDKRPNGEMALYEGNNNFDFVIHNGTTGSNSNRVFSKGIFYGYGGDSADGAGLNTIKLIPDFGVVDGGSDQYLVVDPTVPNHIHLRAGGTIDNSNASMYIGGENSYLNIPNGSNPAINISANNNVWRFDVNGALRFPGASNARIGEDEPGLVVFSDAGFAVVTNANPVSTYEVEFIGYVSNGFGDSPGATLTVTEIVAGTITDGMTIYGAGLPPEGWAVTFGGGVMEPQGTGGTGNYLLSGANILTASQLFNNGVFADGSRSWVFGTDGSLIFSNGGVIRVDNGNLEVGNVTNFNVEAVGVVNIYTDNGNHQWQFGDDGSITFPDATVQTTAWTGVASEGTTSTTSANVGYIGMPQNAKSTSYTLVAGDQGKHIYVTTAGQTITVPANSTTAFPIGTTIAIIAGPTANPVTIDIVSDTMYLGGVGSTGTRTLAAYGMATLVKVDTTTWFINGSGLT